MMPQSPDTLETDRLVLRRPAPRDQDAAVAFFMSERAKGVGGPFDLGGAWRHFSYELGHWEIYGYGMWAVTMKGDDTCLGFIGPWNPPDWPEPEIGWMVFEEAEGKSIAYEAAQATIKHARETLGWTNMVSYIAAGITRSERLAKRLGAVLDPTAKVPDGFYSQVFRHPEGDVS